MVTLVEPNKIFAMTDFKFSESLNNEVLCVTRTGFDKNNHYTQMQIREINYFYALFIST